MACQEGVKALLKFYGKRISSAENSFEAGKINSVQALYTKQSFIKSGNSGNKVRFVLFQQFSVTFRVESWYKQASSAAGQHGMYAYAQSEAMEYRHNCQHLVLNIGLVAMIC